MSNTFLPIRKKNKKIRNFNELNYTKNGLILKYQNKTAIQIHYSEINKTFIKKHPFHPYLKYISIVVPFLIVLFYVPNVSLKTFILVSLCALFLVVLTIYNFKLYSFYIRLNNGKYYRKKFSSKRKNENFSTIEKVRAEYLSYNYNKRTINLSERYCAV